MKFSDKPVVIIPARKNSKRIKDKNIVNFYGQPLIVRTIKNLLNTKLFSNIFVSTDSKYIAKISEKFGANALYPRPKKLANDSTILLDVMEYEITKLEKLNFAFSSTFCILPTAIFLKKRDIINATKLMSETSNYIITAFLEEKNPLRNFYFHNNRLKMLSSKFTNYRTQDLPFTYRDAGQLYLANKTVWKKKTKIFSDKTKVILLDSKKYIDIDTYSDLKKAKKIFKQQKI
jgi:pseudaminic acid cytidylyltransferase